MMRRTAAACAVAAVSFSLAACGGNKMSEVIEKPTIAQDIANELSIQNLTASFAALSVNSSPEMRMKVEREVAEFVIGMDLEEAVEFIEEVDSEASVRVVAVDGEDFMVTMDFQPKRVNVKVVDDKVTEVTQIG